MYIKIQNTVAPYHQVYLFECKTVSWKRLEKGDEDKAEDLVEEMNVGDYGIYDASDDIRLHLVFDDTSVLLERGDIYIMNEEGKTVDKVFV